MAKKKTAVGADIDWYLISIDRLKQIGLVVLILLLGGGGYWFYTNEKTDPKANAESAIDDARQALNALAASKEFTARRSEFDRAQQKLDAAKSLFANAKFAEARDSAIESHTISKTALSGGPGVENDAQFLTVEGDVQFQKSGGDWKKADPRTALFNGDWVKTGDNASAELIFSNGSLYTVGANALLEIYSSINPATSKKTNIVQMQVGSVEVATTGDASTVRTPGSNVVVDSESTTQVGVDKAKATSVVATKGSASVAPTTGGPAVKIETGDKVNATPTGALSQVTKVSLPPALQSPADNQTFGMTGDSKIEFVWESQPGATVYQLQVSRSRLFTTLEINSRRQKATASAKVTSEGMFYWRVASIGPDGQLGPFSPFRRFRVTGGGGTTKGPAPTGNDTEPPMLQLKPPARIGGPFFMVEGDTEPGATVFINDEEVDVESNGHFKKLVSFNKVGRNTVVVKAVDSAGNHAVKSTEVVVEE